MRDFNQQMETVEMCTQTNKDRDCYDNGINNGPEIVIYEDGLTTTDDSGGSSSDGGGGSRKQSSQSERSEHQGKIAKDKKPIEVKLQSLQENVTRTTQFLTELNTLSESCQEHIPALHIETDILDETAQKDRQVRTFL